MKFKLEQVQLILNCLTQLDGYDQIGKVVAKDGSVSESIVRRPYKYSGKTRLKLADTISILESKMRNFEKVRNDIVTEISEGRNIIEKDDKVGQDKYRAAIQSILDDEREIPELKPFSKYELGLDSDEEVNPFPIDVIKAMRSLGLIE